MGWVTTLPPSCADCLEIWEPVQACNGTALLYMYLSLLIHIGLRTVYLATLPKVNITVSDGSIINSWRIRLSMVGGNKCDENWMEVREICR
jgi:hypothetical protein